MRNAPSDSHSRKHAQAVANSLCMADEAAERGDYHDALSWLNAVRATGDRLPDEYQRKHVAWRGKTAEQGSRCSA